MKSKLLYKSLLQHFIQLKISLISSFLVNLWDNIANSLTDGTMVIYYDE